MLSDFLCVLFIPQIAGLAILDFTVKENDIIQLTYIRMQHLLHLFSYFHPNCLSLSLLMNISLLYVSSLHNVSAISLLAKEGILHRK
jgi:hypothetical protein